MGVRAVRPQGRWVWAAAGPLGRWAGPPGLGVSVAKVVRRRRMKEDNDKGGGVRGPRRERHKAAEAGF